ncbi:MAG: ATP-dependent Clp protease adaptor ClpS [Spirosomataceae bacterium]
MFPIADPAVITQEITEEEIESVKLYQLIVFNDDVNTFEYVIQTLIEVCEHSPEQAEQCTIIIHFKGKCSVKEGDFEELAAMRTEICRRGISAEVTLNH